MPTWVWRVLVRVRGLAASGRLRFTDKALAEMLALGLSRGDVLQILAELSPSAEPTRTRSSRGPEWLYEFRHEGVLVSCHEDQTEAEGGADGGA